MKIADQFREKFVIIVGSSHSLFWNFLEVRNLCEDGFTLKKGDLCMHGGDGKVGITVMSNFGGDWDLAYCAVGHEH